MSALVDSIEYTYGSDDRNVTCQCCGTKAPASETITLDDKTFCKDSAACCWRKQGKKVEVDYYPTITAAQKPLFGD